METKENSNEAVENQEILANTEQTASAASDETAKDESVEAAKVTANDTAKKALSNKEIIAYLVEKFPLCFTVKGAAKPLKIGIFQELAEQLAEDEKVSKTRLRQVLRHYTSSWRYLKAIKLGEKRVDLQGEAVAEIDQEQADYAAKTLKESQEKFAQNNPEKFANKKNPAKQGNKNAQAQKNKASAANKAKKATNQKHNAKFDSVKAKKSTAKKPVVNLEKISESAIKVGQAVKVQLGNSPMDAIVKEVVGNDVSVQLSSGMVVKTQISNLYMESTTAK